MLYSQEVDPLKQILIIGKRENHNQGNGLSQRKEPVSVGVGSSM